MPFVLWTQSSSSFFAILVTQTLDLLGGISWDIWGRPRARLLLPDSSRSADRGRSHLPPVVSLLIPNSSKSVADRAFNIYGRVKNFWPSLPGSSTSAADKALLRGFKAREQPSQWQVGKLSAALSLESKTEKISILFITTVHFMSTI